MRRSKKKMKKSREWDWCKFKEQRPEMESGKREEAAAAEMGSVGRRFFGCYLLTSLSPRYKGHSYIGFTVNPKRRIRQHNGEITSGASTTKKKRPWEMVFCIHGFPTQVAALQFEWAWQHPRESVAVRGAAAMLKSLGGLANKIRLAFTMLTLPSWQRLNLTVSFFCTKYMKHTAACPTLPSHMKVHFCSMDELPCYWHPDHPCASDGDDDCDDDDHFNSNTFERSAYFNDETTLVDGWLETHLSANDLQTFTSQDARKDAWTGDERGNLIDPWKGESSAADGSTFLKEREELRGSLSVSKEPTEPFCRADPLEMGSCSLHRLQEPIHPSCQFPADTCSLEGKNTVGGLQDCEETRTKQPRASFSAPDMDYHIESSLQVERCGVSNHESIAVDHAKREEMAYVVIDEISEENHQSTDVQSPLKTVDTFRPVIADGIEVIDLFTPSPDSRVTDGSKKRRVASDSPDIIDLTRSPIFIQL